MAKIDELLSKVTQAQDNVTHLNEKGREFQDATKQAVQVRNDAVAAVLKYVTELENQLADLTPHPDDDAHYSEYDNHSRGW